VIAEGEVVSGGDVAGGVAVVGIPGVGLGVGCSDSVAGGVGVMDSTGSEVSGMVGVGAGGVEVQLINTTRITSNEIIKLHFISVSQTAFKDKRSPTHLAIIIEAPTRFQLSIPLITLFIDFATQ
jgi:hypothetical protein